MKVISNFKNTISSIPEVIDENGHEKIARIMTCIWCLHLIATGIIVYFIVAPGHDDTSFGTYLIVLQLMVSKIFESSNRMYDNCMMIQSNTADIKETILRLIKDYYDVFEQKHTSEFVHDINYISILDERIKDDLLAYSRNMHTWTIILNSFFWKSPEHTPFLEKDAIRDKLIMIINHLNKMRDSKEQLNDTSPEVTSINKVQF